MKIQASTRLRGKGDIRDDNGIGRLALTAENNDEREFITSVYRILAEDGQQQEQGVATMRKFLSDFPDPVAVTCWEVKPMPEIEAETERK